MRRWISDGRPKRGEGMGTGGLIRWAALVLVLLFLAQSCGRKEPGEATAVSGRVSVPLEGALVYIYMEGDDIFAPARMVTELTRADGSFSLSLRPGRYVAVVRKRASGDVAGPVLIGDYRSEPIPFEVLEGRAAQLDLLAQVKLSNEKAFPSAEADDGTSIAGLVRDADGRPVEGIRVHVYDHIQMSERPKYVSEKTGPDGRFLVPVKRGGTYYLAARDRFGGPPQVGDLFGRFDEGTIDPSGVVVRKGEVTEGIEIVVHKVW